MNRIHPAKAAEGTLPEDGLTPEQNEALKIIGQRVIGLTNDLGNLHDPEHTQIVKELIEDFISISRGVAPGYEVSFDEWKEADPNGSRPSGRARKIRRNLVGASLRDAFRIYVGNTWASNTHRPPGISKSQWRVVLIASRALEQLYAKAEQNDPAQVSKNWLRSLACDFRDIVELCGVLPCGGMVPDRYRASSLKEPSVWEN